MKKTLFENLVKKDSYQVFLFSSPATLPASMWTHPWFVINKKGILTRYKILHHPNRTHQNLGYVYIDNFPPLDGMRIFPLLNYPRWSARLLGHIEGGENSVAEKMCTFIENSAHTYNNKHHYSFLGPNSNTYAQWILDNFPEFSGHLKQNAIGKNHAK